MADPNLTMSVHPSHDSHGLELVLMTEDVEVWVCGVCHFLEAYCTHSSNHWNEDGTVLTCDLCGIDGT